MKLNLIVTAVFAVLLAACNPMAQLEGGEDFIERYHTIYNSGDARALYGMAGEEFRSATPVAQMEELVTHIDERMGKVESTERSGFNVNSTNGVTITTVTMTTQFAKGEGVETYVFHGSGDDFRLVSWNVDSPNFDEPAVPQGIPTVGEDKVTE